MKGGINVKLRHSPCVCNNKVKENVGQTQLVVFDLHYPLLYWGINIINLVTSCQFQAPAEFPYVNCLPEPTEEEVW